MNPVANDLRGESARRGEAQSAAGSCLELAEVSKLYRLPGGETVEAVRGVSRGVERGAWIRLTGPSGCGKTTLLMLLGGMQRPTRGAIWCQPHAARPTTNLARCSGPALARMRRELGFVFQQSALIHGLSALDNVGYPLIPSGVSGRERRRRAGELLARLRLGDRQQSRVERLSIGEQQRVAVARAVVSRPAVVLADEPTSNLDDDNAERVLELFRELHQQGTTVLVATHDPRLSVEVAEHWRMEAGELQP